MAKHGPQRYPGASTRYWFQSRYGGDAMESNVIVWHTTEGTSVPSYGGGAVAPNFTAAPDFAAKRLRWYQHFDFDVSSRALENHAGGVETNTMNACQVEIVGTCDPATHRRWGRTPHLYAADLPDWAIRDLAAFARWAHDHHGVKLRSGLTFRPYPSSYGATSTRLTDREWLGFYGHCGHQHVPENVHGDPGAFPMDAILAAASGMTSAAAAAAPIQEDDDMPEYVSLTRPEPCELEPGREDAIEFTREYADGLHDHAKHGSQFIHGPAHYQGTAYLELTGVDEGAQVQVRISEVDRDDGDYAGNGGRGEYRGTAGSTFVAYPFTDSTPKGEGVRLRIKHFSSKPVTVKHVTLKALVWPR